MGALALHVGEVEVTPGGTRTDVDVYLHDSLLGFPHSVATQDLPNIGQVLLMSYFGGDGETCFEASAQGVRGSTTIARRVISVDCLFVVSRSDTELVLTDDSQQQYDHHLVITEADQIHAAVVPTGEPIGLRVLAGRGWHGADLQITLVPEACD